MLTRIRKNQKGFTLVEVIVVAVIVAVLAAVAIPLYMGYIHDSRLNVANNTAGTIASACGATKQQDPTIVPKGDFKEDEKITFPGIDAPGVSDNSILVPKDYTVNIDFDGTATGEGKVTVKNTKDNTITSKVYGF